MTKRYVGLLSLVVSIGLLSGCGGDSGPATVHGKVTYQGKPLVCGMVNLVGPTGLTQGGAIELDGTFVVVNAPTGVVKVGVISDKPVPPSRYHKEGAGAPPPPPAVDPSKWFPIDAKYADPATSGKELKLTSGNNNVTIALE